NSVKYAWPDRQSGHIAIRVEQQQDMIVIEFRNDGVEYPKEVLRMERHGVGWELIQALVAYGLQGEVTLHNDQGAVTTIRFPA
ncbi:MAG: ATP-binding protein, partial [Anaerolineae bacterium]